MVFIPYKESSFIVLAPIIHVDGAFYVIGGLTISNNFSKTIARLDSSSYEWSKAGDLTSGRHSHNAIFDGSDIIVIGGFGGFGVPLNTEKCSIAKDKVTCIEQEPSLLNYKDYPELFLVEENFCK